MPEDGDEKINGKKRLTREEYDKLVRGVDGIYFGGLVEADDDKKTLPEKSPDETTKREDDGN